MSQRKEALEIANHVLATLDDLADCGRAYSILKNQMSLLLSDLSNCQTEAFKSLVTLADEQILTFHYDQVPTCWLRLYTDATLLHVISLILSDCKEQSQWMSAVRDLDMALIVAGTPGCDRRNHVHRLLKSIQSNLPGPCPSRDSKRKRRKLDHSPPVYIANPIPSFSADEAPSIEDYMGKHGDSPLIIKEGHQTLASV